MNDYRLIERMRDGDRSAFGDLYARHWECCIKYASLLVGSLQAEDAVQEVFVKLWRNKRNLVACESLRPYLLRSVYNISLNILRSNSVKESYKNKYAHQIDMRSSSQYDPDRCSIITDLFTKEVQSSIDEAIERLPDRCQTIFRMSFIHGLSHKDIAEKLEISVSTVDNQIYKALKLIRAYIPKEYMAILALVISLNIQLLQ